MPIVISRKAALATPALESKSMLRRNAAQSPLPTSSIIAVAPPIASTIAAGPNRRCRIASSTSSVAITSEPCRPSANGGRTDRYAASRRRASCGSSTRSRPGTTNNDTASSATVTTARWTCTLTSARLTSTVMMPPVTPPRLHRPCSRFITGVRRRELSTDPCTFIATSMNTSKNSRPTRPTINIAGAVAKPTIGSEPIDMIVPMITTRRVPSLAITRPGQQAADQAGDAGQGEDETERADRDPDAVTDLRQLAG